jgi:hypothetical protein
MEINVGDTDRYIRIGLGALLLALGAAGYAGILPVANFAPQALTSVALAVIGLVLIATGAVQKCMIYSLLGYSTAEE